jgi:hypothetical protein
MRQQARKVENMQPADIRLQLLIKKFRSVRQWALKNGFSPDTVTTVISRHCGQQRFGLYGRKTIMILDALQQTIYGMKGEKHV